MNPLVRSVRRGWSPNCSSAGSVVGVALTSVVLTAAVLSIWAERYVRWLNQGGAGMDEDAIHGVLRHDGRLHLSQGDDAAILELTDQGLELARDRARVGQPGPQWPTEVHVAVTGRCPAACTACYLNAGPDQGHDPDAQGLRETLTELAGRGVLEVAFGGGEGLLRTELFELAEHARSVGLVPNLTTSGFGLTPARAARCAALFGQVNVSLDGLGPIYVAARGWDGAALGLTAIERLADAGARVGVNTLLTRQLLEAGLHPLGQAIARRGAREWQWLRLKPTGRGAQAWETLAPSWDQLDALWPHALNQERETGLRVRFDCALVPFLVQHDVSLETLTALGIRGCPGGDDLWARDAQGQWAPCSFAPSGTRDWRSDPALQAWRARAQDPPEPCASCRFRSVCRGGCRVVAHHLTGDAMAPDPECPRVRG